MVCHGHPLHDALEPWFKHQDVCSLWSVVVPRICQVACPNKGNVSNAISLHATLTLAVAAAAQSNDKTCSRPGKVHYIVRFSLPQGRKTAACRQADKQRMVEECWKVDVHFGTSNYNTTQPVRQTVGYRHKEKLSDFFSKGQLSLYLISENKNQCRKWNVFFKWAIFHSQWKIELISVIQTTPVRVMAPHRDGLSYSPIKSIECFLANFKPSFLSTSRSS